MSSSSMHRFGSYLRTKWASPGQIRFWLLVFLILYTLLGFFGLPWMIQSMAESTAKEDFGRELRIESVQTNPFTLTLSFNDVELDDIDKRLLLGWNRLFVDLSWSSITNQAWTFETIQLDQPVIQEERFASGQTRLSRLAAELSTEETPAKEEPAPLPELRVNQLSVVAGVVRFADNLKNAAADADKSTQVSLALDKVDLSVKDFTLQKGRRFPVHLEGQFMDGGTLSFDGKLQLLPTLALEGSASIDKLALEPAEPYLRQFVNVKFESGTLTLNGNIQTDVQQPFAFQGAASINSLGLSEGSSDESLIGWQSLQITQLQLSLKDKQINTQPIIVEGLFGRVVIHRDKTTNIGQLVISQTEDAKENDDKTTPFSIALESIELTDGTLQFADNSLPLPFSTRIHTLSGEVSTLSSVSAEPAQVKLQGEVAEYGLAQIEGTIHAWHPARQTNVHLIFSNLEIPEYSPYTVEFAGRKIEGGTMDLDLNYTISDNQLDGQNNLLLRDLKLGEEMASSDAMDLPLNLAIALLQDSDGVIDLTLPVSGDVGNPQFDFGKIIQQAIGNAITSVVTAPFSFLASLIGADSEDLGKVEFQAGGTDLLAPQRARIAKLRKALNQRPNLILELAGPFNQGFDGPVIQRQKAIAILQDRLAEQGREVRNPSLTAESNQDIVETMFSTFYPQQDLEALKTDFTEKRDDPTGEPSFDALAYRNQLAKQIIAAQSVTDAELKVIAKDRASAVQNALVNPDEDTSVAAERVRILEPTQVESVEGKYIAMAVNVSTN